MDDEATMHRAIANAESVRAVTWPNPWVGAVIETTTDSAGRYSLPVPSGLVSLQAFRSADPDGIAPPNFSAQRSEFLVTGPTTVDFNLTTAQVSAVVTDSNGLPILGDDSIGGLTVGTDYYVIVVGEGKIKLAASEGDAKADTPVAIDLTSSDACTVAPALPASSEAHIRCSSVRT